MDHVLTNCKLTAESGTFIFAICNLVLSAGVSIAAISIIIYALAQIWWDPFDLHYIFTEYSWIFFYSLCAAICLLFSVILLLGILRRNRLFLRLYLIYGISTIVVTTLFTIIYMLLIQHYMAIPIAALFVLALYGLVLYMIRRVYTNYCKYPSGHDILIPRYLQIIKEIYTFNATTLSETITRFFAAFNLTVAVISFIIGICFVVYGIWAIGFDLMMRYTESFSRAVEVASRSGYTVVPLFFSSISLGFAILLANGLRERNTTQVKAYFIYGGVVESLSVLFTVLYIALTGGKGLIPTAVSFCLCGLYGYILLNIYKTYKSFDTELNGIEIGDEGPTEEKTLNYEHDENTYYPST